MNEIQVIVVGGANSGKSTIATAIRNALEKAGLNVEFRDPDYSPQLQKALEQYQERRLVSLVERGTSVNIVTEQTNRNPPQLAAISRRKHLTLVHNADAEPQQLAA